MNNLDEETIIDVDSLKEILNVKHYNNEDSMNRRIKDLLTKTLITFFNIFIFCDDGSSEEISCKIVDAFVWKEKEKVISYEINRQFNDLLKRDYLYSWVRLIHNKTGQIEKPICKKDIKLIDFFNQN